MMKRGCLAVAALGVSATAALAHPGDHTFSVISSLAHLLTEPNHLAMMAIAALAGLGLWRWTKSKA